MTRDIIVANYEDIALEISKNRANIAKLKIPGRPTVLWVLHDPVKHNVSFEEFKISNLKYSVYPAFHADTVLVFSQEGRVRILKSR